MRQNLSDLALLGPSVAAPAATFFPHEIKDISVSFIFDETDNAAAYSTPADCTACISARHLFMVSSHSLVGSESATMPAPACRLSKPF